VKTRFDLLPWSSVTDIADVLSSGAAKYGASNWCRGTEWSRYFSALCRHIFAWWLGEDNDKETGRSHLAHAGCCLLFLMEYQRNGWGSDDRIPIPDGEVFVKNDGMKAVNSSSPVFDYDLYKQVLATHPKDASNLNFSTNWKKDDIDLGLD
tara:strand:+ start:3934 stop:4386 length:453 start_codon:yes stop_codon:yes gene_type:complete